MPPKTLEQVLELRRKEEDLYETVQYPIWSWPGTSVFPGGTLIAQAAAAAYNTVSSEFTIDGVQAHFLAGADPKQPLLYRVKRLSDGGRFLTRVVTGEQKDRVMIHVTCSFVRGSSLAGPSMSHSVARQGKRTIDSITLDDFELAQDDLGPYMQFQRLPLEYVGDGYPPKQPCPESLVYTSVASITPEMSSSESRLHSLGILALSDYHVLDCPPTLHNHPFGLPRIGDTTRTRTDHHFQFYTSLNHTVHFRAHKNFRADDLCYIEVTSPWADERRAEVHSRIFDRGGTLIATCVQEAYYVLKEEKALTKL